MNFAKTLILACVAALPCWWGTSANAQQLTPLSNAVYVLNDDSETYSALDSIINRAIAQPELELAVVVKETQLNELTRDSKYEDDIKDAMSYGVKFYVCDSELHTYKVSESSLISGTRVVKKDKTTGVSGIYKHQPQIKKICEPH